MNSYQLRQVNDNGLVLAEEHVVAESYRGALRHVTEVDADAQRIEVYNDHGQRAGEISVDYLRIKGPSRG